MTNRTELVAVLVLYRCVAEQSPCFQSLRHLLEATPELADGFSLLLYDNSPAPRAVPAFPGAVTYLHDAANGGVAAAYNAGLSLARERKASWLLLLDQDTELTAGYLAELRALARSVPPEVAAIVPRLVQDGHVHSPREVPRWTHRALPAEATGLLRQQVTAFNSGACLRTAAIEQFPQRYWLDFLDHAVFHELQRKGGRVWLMQSTLAHGLSAHNLDQDSSPSRYLNQLQAERDFYCEYGSPTDRIYYRLRRAKQTLGQLLKVRDKRFALLSARATLGLLPPTLDRRLTRLPTPSADPLR